MHSIELCLLQGVEGWQCQQPGRGGELALKALTAPGQHTAWGPWLAFVLGARRDSESGFSCSQPSAGQGRVLWEPHPLLPDQAASFPLFCWLLLLPYCGEPRCTDLGPWLTLLFVCPSGGRTRPVGTGVGVGGWLDCRRQVGGGMLHFLGPVCGR